MARTAGWCVMLMLAVSPAAWATEFRTGDVVSVEADEVIADDLFAAGGSVRIAGRVEGDVFAAGQVVRVTGPVGGSVMVAGQQVEVSGNVAGSVRAAGHNVILSGSVGRNGAAAGQTVVVEDGAKFGQDLHVGAAIVDLRGSVGRKADVGAATAVVGGGIGDRLYFQGDKLTLGPGARVGGDLVYCCADEVEMAEGAYVGGVTKRITPKKPGPRPAKAPPSPIVGIAMRALGTTFFFLIVFVFGVVGLAAVPRVFGAAANAVGNRPWWNVLLGILALVVVPVAGVAVCATVIGIPIGMLALVLWGAALVFSGVPVGTSLGRWLVRRVGAGRPSVYLGLFVGLLVLTLLGHVPILGIVIKVLTVLLGLGVYTRVAKGLLVELRRQPA